MSTPHVLDLALGLHIGMQRQQNEDAVGYRHPGDWHVLNERGVLIVLADGVGGLRDGELASDRAVRLVLETYYAPGPFAGVQAQLSRAITDANRNVRQHYSPSATTIVAAVIHQRQLTLTHLGDSRAYLLRAASRSLEQLTHDHTTAVQRPDGRVKHKLTAALGHTEKIELNYVSRALEVGDRLLVMSDGVIRYFDHAQLSAACARYAGSAALTAYLIHESNRSGGIDNISVAVAELSAEQIDRAGLPRIAERMTPEAVFVQVNDPVESVAPPVIFGPEEPVGPAAVTPTHNAMTSTTPPRRSNRLRVLLLTALIVALASGFLLTDMDSMQPADPTAAPAFIPTDSPQAAPDTTPAPAHTVDSEAETIGDEGPPPELAENQHLTFSDAATTFTRIGENTTAFVIDTGRTYRVHALFAHADTIWVRLYDPATERLGWVEKDNLPPYRLEN